MCVGATLSLSVAPARRARAVAADGRRPPPAHAEDALGGRHAPSALRAGGAPREARRPDPAPADQPDPLSRCARAARAMARQVGAFGALPEIAATAPNLESDSGDD